MREGKIKKKQFVISIPPKPQKAYRYKHKAMVVEKADNQKWLETYNRLLHFTHKTRKNVISLEQDRRAGRIQL